MMQRCPEDCAEADGARDPKRCWGLPVLWVGCMAAAAWVCLTCDGEPPASAEGWRRQHGSVPGQPGCRHHDKGFFQAVPAGGKCKGHRSAPS